MDILGLSSSSTTVAVSDLLENLCLLKPLNPVVDSESLFLLNMDSYNLGFFEYVFIY